MGGSNSKHEVVQSREEAPPIPPEEELLALFASSLDEANIPQGERQQLDSLSADRKWQIVLDYRKKKSLVRLVPC